MYQTKFKCTTLCSCCSIIGQLERLKREAADVQKKVEETDVVMAEVEAVSQQYLPLSAACSSMYFTLESLNQVSIIILCWLTIEEIIKYLVAIFTGYPC